MFELSENIDEGLREIQKTVRVMRILPYSTPGLGSHLEFGEFLLAVLPGPSSYNINCIKSVDH